MKEEVLRVEILDFNEYVVMSKARRAKKDKDGKITNPRVAGKPKLWKING